MATMTTTQRATADVPPSPGDLELGDEAALADTLLLDRAGPCDDADTNGDARLGMLQHLERGSSGSKSDASDDDAVDPSLRSSIIRALDIFASPEPQAQAPPWLTPAVEERTEEPSMAALLAQLDNGDADVDGEEDADTARTLAAEAGARGSRGVRPWEAPDGSGAPLETVARPGGRARCEHIACEHAP
jgi:hypothetical protein